MANTDISILGQLKSSGFTGVADASDIAYSYKEENGIQMIDQSVKDRLDNILVDNISVDDIKYDEESTLLDKLQNVDGKLLQIGSIDERINLAKKYSNEAKESSQTSNNNLQEIKSIYDTQITPSVNKITNVENKIKNLDNYSKLFASMLDGAGGQFTILSEYEYAKKCQENSLVDNVIYLIYDEESIAEDIIMYELNASVDKPDHGWVKGSGAYIKDHTAKLNVVCDAGWKFVEWDDHNIENPRDVFMNENKEFIATIEQDSNYNPGTGEDTDPTNPDTGGDDTPTNPDQGDTPTNPGENDNPGQDTPSQGGESTDNVTITVTANPANTGHPTGSGTYPKGSAVEIETNPAEGYVAYTLNGNVLSQTSYITIPSVNSDNTYVITYRPSDQTTSYIEYSY